MSASDGGYIEFAKVFINSSMNVLKLKCSYCSQEIKGLQFLRRHILDSHKDVLQERRAKARGRKVETKSRPTPTKALRQKRSAPELVLIAAGNYNEADMENENDSTVHDAKPLAKPNDFPEDDCSGLPTSEEEFSEGEEHETAKIFKINESSRVFYNLGRTQKHIILDFIDIIRDNPCLWDPSDEWHNIREVRVESSKRICVELKERWNINVSEQTARASVLQLCRWFEREYVRSLMGHTINYPDYYGKLYEFLPRDHLKALKCKECQRIFKTDQQLSAHKHQAHNGQMPFKCEYCGRTFQYRSSFLKHENRHTKRHVYQCTVCEYSSPSRNDYQLHLTTHSDVRAYKCEICGAKYKSSTALGVHRRSHKPAHLECAECGKKFREAYRLKLHLRRHTQRDQVKVTEISKRRFVKGNASNTEDNMLHRRLKEGCEQEEELQRQSIVSKAEVTSYGSEASTTEEGSSYVREVEEEGKDCMLEGSFYVEENFNDEDDCNIEEDCNDERGTNGEISYSNIDKESFKWEESQNSEGEEEDDFQGENVELLSCLECQLDFLYPEAFAKHSRLFHS